ncbi:MAG TPA: hypothetical protein VE954_15285 [Oligoflexus sp.]|uniref:hypothetical protein n=1 Tax=Oligoflexus sp. TaxID=1971216 RepID=UPI002D22CE49|nr:hypothetical protein [Oligoflexus sp.]HYX34467.1 hypothetical protein [Oligoflexus sp.]
MKRLAYLPLAILSIMPVTGFAHKVPFGAAHCANTDEEADVEEIPLCAEEEKETAAATAFCLFTSRTDITNCTARLLNFGMAESAGKCVDEALQNLVDLKIELHGHKVGGGPTSTEGGYWHLEYRYSKQDGWHRHDWGAAARDKAGRENGTAAVREAKDSAAGIKTTTEAASETSFLGKFGLDFGIKGAANLAHEAGVDHRTSKGTSVETGPIGDKEAKKIYDVAYKLGAANPNVTTVSPDIMCEKDQPKCGSSFSRDIINEDFIPKPKKSDEKSSDTGSKDDSKCTSHCSSDKSSKSPPPPSSNSDKTGKIDHKFVGSYAGDPSPVTKPGEMLASYDQVGLNPVEKCLFETYKEQVSRDTNKSYNPDGPNKTTEQRKKEAQGLLRKGICNAKYFGPAFCQKHKTFKLTGGQMQDPQDEKTTKLDELKDLEKMDFGNPKDYEDKTPIDFSHTPKTSPDDSDDKIIVRPGRN